jgi:hypothetical protein
MLSNVQKIVRNSNFRDKKFYVLILKYCSKMKEISFALFFNVRLCDKEENENKDRPNEIVNKTKKNQCSTAGLVRLVSIAADLQGD